jgi:hypothetical protein
MNDLATQFALDNPAVGKEVHKAQEGEGDDEGEEGSEIGSHAFVLGGFSVLTQNAAFQRGTIVYLKF